MTGFGQKSNKTIAMQLRSAYVGAFIMRFLGKPLLIATNYSIQASDCLAHVCKFTPVI